MFKRITSLFMAVIMSATCLAGATNSYASDNKYNTDESEILIFDGNEYQYVDEYIDGKEITHIINLTENTEDILYYDEANGTIYLNNKPIAYVEDAISSENIFSEYGTSPFADNYWKWHDTSTKHITWIQGVTAAILAGIIAAVIPTVGKATVIAKIGLNALGVVAAACAGAYVDCVAYTHVLSDGKVQLRYDWTFRPSTGDKYGPYSSYSL